MEDEIREDALEGPILPTENIPVSMASQQPIEPIAPQPPPTPAPLPAPTWFAAMRWSANPFTFVIEPDLLVGYAAQAERLRTAIESQQKFIYIAGPTGSGKTTMLAWLMREYAQRYDIIFLAKPPATVQELGELLLRRTPPPWYAFWKRHALTIYDVPAVLAAQKRRVLLIIDEVHEAENEVLEWIRVLGDQVKDMIVILAGLPVFEQYLRENLETFRKRISARIDLVSLTKEETAALVRRRIASVGGAGNEFDAVLDTIFATSGGFPREIIRVCDEIVMTAMQRGATAITNDLLQREMPKQETVSLGVLSSMTPMQRGIVELLATEPMTPGDIANTHDLAKYKSRQHAVRSINNVMKKLYEDGYLDRRKADKAYVYSLSGKLRTIVVKA